MHSSILLPLAAAALASAHGIVQDLKIGSTVVGGYNPFQDPYMNPVPQRIVWAFPEAGNGPVEDVTSSDIVCNKGATAAPVTATAQAGDEVTFFWTEWPESHRGPVMTYLADCGGDCSEADPTKLDFFKIDHAGFEGGEWISDKIIANNNSYTVQLPADIKPSNYLLRHELLALHAAFGTNGAQFYPMCANLKIEGTGTATPAGVKFPGAYKPTDAGILVDIYQGLTEYEIPGPAVYSAGGAAPAPAPEEPASSVVATPSSSAAAAPAEPTSSAVAAPTTSAAAAPTTVTPPTFSSAPVVVAPQPTVAVPTTLATATRPATSAPAVSAPAGEPVYDKTPEGINKCLDAVNDCIRKKQAGNTRGGAMDFSDCESKRSACY